MFTFESRSMRYLLTSIALVLIGAQTLGIETGPVGTPKAGRRMSFHNRLLLNRAAVAGLKSIEVLLLAAADRQTGDAGGQAEEVSALVTRLGGRVHRIEETVGYLRLEIPTDRLLELVASPVVEAYQISSFSRASWYRDGPPLLNAEMFRGFEITPIAATEPGNKYADLPPLSIAASRESGYTADDDVGIGEWMAQHPTFDGRGVTIALIENALPSFADPTLRTAKALDGRDVPKIAGILNTIDPAYPDETRVVLGTEVSAATSWARIGGRTYILPRPGTYRFGLLVLSAGANLVHQFGVIEHERTREVWIDANGDASFQDETPLADVNERFEPRFLKLTHPRKADVSFVMGRGREASTVHIYVGRGSHQAMTLSVAAGSKTEESLAYGVAPNARVLLVRESALDFQLGSLFEGFIEAAKRPDVDVTSASAGMTMVPDTAGDFAGLLFARLVHVYRKPIISSAHNTQLQLGSSLALGAALSVGGSLGPKTFAALHGGRALERLIIHPMGGAGPSLDGAIKPDFVAPMERISTDLPWNRDLDAVPRNAPSRRLPPGYQISCCTSASSPYAAGVAALLISAAKQTKAPYSLESLERAMKFSARFLSGFQSHEQGNGVLDIDAAWRELTNAADAPRIVASAEIVHPLAQYAAHGSDGQGILEFKGWKAGMTGKREIRFRRESGPDEALSYRLSWTGNDGTFYTVPSVTLPLGKTIAVPVNIAIKSAGAHSALLNLHDQASNAIVFRTQATIVAPEQINASTGSVRLTGTVGLMRTNPHYVDVPAGAGAIIFELEVIRGVVRPTILPAHGLFPGYYLHVHPRNVSFVGKGKYNVILPNPEPGTWTIHVASGSSWFRITDDAVPGDDGDAEYAVTVRVLSASVRAAESHATSVATHIHNLGSTIGEPVLEASAGTLKSHRGTFLSTGLPNVIEISVPKDAATLSLQLRSEDPRTSAVELYLYDCTSGECFSYDIAFPAAVTHTMVVRRPNAGRWVAAINGAPFPTAAGGFVLDEIITTGTPRRYPSTSARPPGARWTETVEVGGIPAAEPGRTGILFLELIDAAAEREEAARPWDPSPNRRKLRDRPVALAATTYRR